MRPLFLEASDLNDLWFQLLYNIFDHGRYYILKDKIEEEKRLEFDFVSARVKYPGADPLIPVIPDSIGVPSPVDMAYVHNALSYYLLDVKKENETYTYGQSLSPQIDWVIEEYKKYGEGTRHCYMTLGSDKTYLKYKEGEGKTQCLRGVDTAIKYGKLHFSIHFRSWNLWSGLPGNLACLQIVKKYMADEIGVEDGEIFITCLKLGLQESVWPLAMKRIGLIKDNKNAKR